MRIVEQNKKVVPVDPGCIDFPAGARRVKIVIVDEMQLHIAEPSDRINLAKRLARHDGVTCMLQAF